MLPYFRPDSIHLGPLTLEPFGIFAAAGVYLGTVIISRQARRQKLDSRPLVDFAFWGVLAGVVMGHLVHLFLYHPEELSQGSMRILRVWDGLSSFGGLFGGILAAMVYFRVKGIPFHRYSDVLAVGLAPGWAVARVGCFVVHDHPGIRSDFFLAVAYPGGGRHDLGLYDALFLGTLALVLWLLARRKLLEGRLMGLLALVYGMARFGFDFLRATDMPYVDKRYAGLTPAQYGCFLLVGYGLYQLLSRRRETHASRGAATA